MSIRGVTYRVFCLVLLPLLPAVARSQWIAANGSPILEGRSVKCFAIRESTLFVGSWGTGMFRSTDGGESWDTANAGLTDSNVYALAVFGTKVLAGTLAGGIFRSTDDGISWEAASDGLTNLSVLALHADTTTVFAGTLGGLFRSTDEGQSWTGCSTGLTNTNVHAIVRHDTALFAGTRGGGVFRSTDRGDTWTAANTGLGNLMVETFCSSGGGFLAGTWGGGVFRSTDDGASWSAANTGLTTYKVWAICTHDALLFAGTDEGIFRSSDNGGSWLPTNTGIPLVYYGGFYAPTPVMALIGAGTDLLAGSQDFGAFRLEGNGDVWTKLNPYLGGMSIYALATKGDTVFAAASGSTPSEDGVYRSTNYGVTWRRSLMNPAFVPFGALGISGSTLVAGTKRGIYRSTDLGQTWSPLIDMGANDIVYNLEMYGTTIVASAYDGGIYRSTDMGGTWIKDLEEFTCYSLTRHDSTIFAGGYTGHFFGAIYRSTNLGQDWNRVYWDTLLDDTPINNVITYGSQVLANGAMRTGNFTLSTDNGETWDTPWQAPVSQVFCWAVHGTNLFAGTWNTGVQRTMDMGGSWTAMNTGLVVPGTIYSLVMGDSLCFAGTSFEGVYRRPVQEIVTSVSTQSTGTPADFTLFQNYPNPFNPETKIAYSLPVESDLTIRMYDLLGREVLTLFHGKETAGDHRIAWNPWSLPSGVYFCRMEASSTNRPARTFRQVIKMLLLK
jgi:photosystem II stability/assembly factor-like uncharacterized protein